MDYPRKKKAKCEIKDEKRTPTELKFAPLTMWREPSTPLKKKQREEPGPARNKILDPCTLLDSLKEEELAIQDKAISASVQTAKLGTQLGIRPEPPLVPHNIIYYKFLK